MRISVQLYQSNQEPAPAPRSASDLEDIHAVIMHNMQTLH